MDRVIQLFSAWAISATCFSRHFKIVYRFGYDFFSYLFIFCQSTKRTELILRLFSDRLFSAFEECTMNTHENWNAFITGRDEGLVLCKAKLVAVCRSLLEFENCALVHIDLEYWQRSYYLSGVWYICNEPYKWLMYKLLKEERVRFKWLTYVWMTNENCLMFNKTILLR